MTILVASVTPARILIGVDSIVMEPDGTQHEVSKLSVVALAGIVVAMRGNLNVRDYVVALALGGRTRSLDECVPEVLHRFDERVRQMQIEGAKMRIPEMYRPGRDQQMVLAGYSAARGRMIAVAIDNATGKAQSEIVTEDAIYGPGVPLAHPLEVQKPPESDAELLAVAKLQVAYVRAHYPQFGSGGRLLVAEVTRDQIITRVAGAL